MSSAEPTPPGLEQTDHGPLVSPFRFAVEYEEGLEAKYALLRGGVLAFLEAHDHGEDGEFYRAVEALRVLASGDPEVHGG